MYIFYSYPQFLLFWLATSVFSINLFLPLVTVFIRSFDLYFHFKTKSKKQRMVSNKKLRHTIQMTNDRPVYNLPLVNYNVYWPIIGQLYCMTSFFIGHYTLFPIYDKWKPTFKINLLQFKLLVEKFVTN